MIQELILVRHGEASHVIEKKTGGWSESHLTDKGRQQAELTGTYLVSWLHGKPIDLYSSDLLRARQTAERIGHTLGVQPQYCPELRELNNGIAKDKTLTEAAMLRQPMTEPVLDWIPYPEGESWRMMTMRIMTWLETMVDHAEQDTVVIVSHANAMIPMIHWWLQLEEKYYSLISYELTCCSVTGLKVNTWNERTIYKLNDTAHLHDIEETSRLSAKRRNRPGIRAERRGIMSREENNRIPEREQ